MLENPLDRHAHLFREGHSDAEIVDMTDQPLSAVRTYRATLPPTAPPKPVEPVPPRRRGRASSLESFAPELGKVSDAEIAARAGVSRSAVTKFRTRRGIAGDAARPPRKPIATERPTSAPRRRRSKMDEVLHLIGVRSDTEVAALAGVTPDNVRNYRRRHGIAAAGRSVDVTVPAAAPPAEAVEAPRPRRKPGRKTPIDAYAHLLGTVPDAEVARLAGASVAAVATYRMRRKVPPFRATVPPERPTPAPAPPQAPVSEAHAPPPPVVAAPPAREEPPAVPASLAYKVLAANAAERKVFLVVAGDVVEGMTAAVRGLAARGDGPWRILGIRAAGEGLR
ncbi:MAG: hypothetical protein ACOZNI_07945 [Myxococcota bacterium]